MQDKQRHGRLLKAYLKLAHTYGLKVVKVDAGWEITLPESGATHICETVGAFCTYIKAYTEESKDNGE